MHTKKINTDITGVTGCGICYVTMCPDQRIYNSFFDQSLTVSLAYDYRELSLSSLGKWDMHGKKQYIWIDE